MLHCTAAASSAVPSLNFTPSRSFNVQTVLSPLGVSDCANCG